MLEGSWGNRRIGCPLCQRFGDQGRPCRTHVGIAAHRISARVTVATERRCCRRYIKCSDPVVVRWCRGTKVQTSRWEPSWDPFTVDWCGRVWTPKGRRNLPFLHVEGCGRRCTPLGDPRIRRLGVRVPPGVKYEAPVIARASSRGRFSGLYLGWCRPTSLRRRSRDSMGCEVDIGRRPWGGNTLRAIPGSRTLVPQGPDRRSAVLRIRRLGVRVPPGVPRNPCGRGRLCTALVQEFLSLKCATVAGSTRRI